MPGPKQFRVSVKMEKKEKGKKIDSGPERYARPKTIPCQCKNEEKEKAKKLPWTRKTASTEPCDHWCQNKSVQ